MKTTVELPDGLLREVKLRAVYEGRKLKDVIADLLRKGLDAPDEASDAARGRVTRDDGTGLPLVQCSHPARAEQALTPERVAELLLEQELDRFHDLAG